MSVSPSEAWHEGTNMLTALRIDPAQVRGWVMSEVGRLIKELDMKTTINSDEELIFCVNSIIQEHPTIKLEELRSCFNMIRMGKFGKLYERLKTPEILECLCRYEGEVRVLIMEKKMHEDKFIKREETIEVISASGLKDVVNEMVIEPIESKGEGLGTRLRKKLNWE